MGFVGGGVMKIIPTYVSEIADDRYDNSFIGSFIYFFNKIVFSAYMGVTFSKFVHRIRGALNSMMILTMNAGFLVGYILVDFLDYYGQIKANITYPMLFLALFNFFPESPGYLLRQQQVTVREYFKFNNRFPFFLISIFFVKISQAAEQSKQFYSGVKVTPSSENGIDQQEKAYDKFENENMSLSLADFCASLICLYMSSKRNEFHNLIIIVL